MTYFGTRLSDNISRRDPEGYLICLNVPVARTGTQEYLPEELGLPPGGPPVPVFRPEEEVFSAACMASFEGMPVTDDHPSFPEGVTADNIRYLQKGHAHNVRRGAGPEADLLLADLIITDPTLIDEVLAGKREISCGYNYSLCQESDRYVQRDIRGNHIAVVDAGRAGPRVSIRDHLKPTHTDERSMPTMNRTPAARKARTHRDSYARRTARLMAMMARDGETAELAEMIAELVEPEPAEVLAPDTPAEEIAETVEAVLETAAPAEEPVAVAVPEDHTATIDCGPEIISLLQQIISLLQPAADCGTSSEPTHDEDPVTEAVAEAVAETVAEPDASAAPLEALVAEAVEEVVAGETAPEDALLGEVLEAALSPEVLDEDPEAVPQDPDEVTDAAPARASARTSDALREALVAVRPALQAMAPAARRQAVRRIADSLRARKAGASAAGGRAPALDAYSILRGAARRGDPSVDADLGRRIMEKRNANLRSK